MAKPIVVIYFPDNFLAVGGERSWIYQYMRYLNGEHSDGAPTWGERKDYWDEYYWFCFYKYDIDEPQLQVFYEKDFTEIQYEELKQLITDAIEQHKLKSK